MGTYNKIMGLVKYYIYLKKYGSQSIDIKMGVFLGHYNRKNKVKRVVVRPHTSST